MTPYDLSNQTSLSTMSPYDLSHKEWSMKLAHCGQSFTVGTYVGINFCFQHLPLGRRLKVPLAKKEYLQEMFYTHCCFSFKCGILICFKCVCVCMHACVHACMHACVCACMCVHARMWMHVCSEHYSCVCGCVSVEEAGAGEWGENVRVRFLRIYFIFIVI